MHRVSAAYTLANNPGLYHKTAAGLWYAITINHLHTLHMDLRYTQLPALDACWRQCALPSVVDLSVHLPHARCAGFLRSCCGTQLRRLHIGLAGTNTTDRAAKKLGHLLQNFAGICNLSVDLRNNHVMDVGLNALLSAMHHMAVLTTLHLQLNFNHVTNSCGRLMNSLLKRHRYGSHERLSEPPV